jgi:hypothetical protein
MSNRKPRADRVRIQSRKIRADLTEFITGINYDFSPEQVAELEIVAIDPTGRLARSPLAELGTEVRMTDDTAARWSVGSIEATYGAGITWSYRCRSLLAKELRQTFKMGAEVKVSPSEWVTRRVRAAGGQAVTQPSTKRIAIGQGGKDDAQSSLDIITDLASELEWSWVEHSNTLFFGHPYWAWQGNTRLPMYPLTWKKNPRSDAIELRVNLSDDDVVNRGNLDVIVPAEYGRRLRPWNRLRVDVPGRYSGVWLIESVTFADDDVSTVDVSCILPRRPRKKGGST